MVWGVGDLFWVKLAEVWDPAWWYQHGGTSVVAPAWWQGHGADAVDLETD